MMGLHSTHASRVCFLRNQSSLKYTSGLIRTVCQVSKYFWIFWSRSCSTTSSQIFMNYQKLELYTWKACVYMWCGTDHWEELPETVCSRCPPQYSAVNSECPPVREHLSSEIDHPGVCLWKKCRSPKSSEDLDLLELTDTHTFTAVHGKNFWILK